MDDNTEQAVYLASKKMDLVVYAFLGYNALSGLAKDLLWELPNPNFPFGSHIIEQTVPALAILPVYYLAKRKFEDRFFSVTKRMIEARYPIRKH